MGRYLPVLTLNQWTNIQDCKSWLESEAKIGTGEHPGDFELNFSLCLV